MKAYNNKKGSTQQRFGVMVGAVLHMTVLR